MPSIVRSILAVFAGLLVVVILSEGTDALLRAARIFPPLDNKADYTAPMLLAATAYRTLAGIVGGYLTAALAPNSPMRHTVVLGVIGLTASVAGVVANMMYQLGPDWYPIALAVTSFPSVWIGGRLRAAPKRVAHS